MQLIVVRFALLFAILVGQAAARVLGEGAAGKIQSGLAYVETGFVPPLLADHLRSDAHALAKAGLFVEAGSGGRAGAEDTMRSALTCDPIDRSRMLGRWDAFFALWERLDLVRLELEADLGVALLPEMEISYVRYPAGGFYQRHVDDDEAAAHPAGSQRRVSFVCSLVDAEWSAADGGALRCFTEGGTGGAYDLLPCEGALVLFDSCRVEHEVLPTKRERLVVVGWWHTPCDAVPTIASADNANAVASLLDDAIGNGADDEWNEEFSETDEP
jgi:hypothetical protein